ncbi:MAG: hypothetical protein HRU20_17870 [Pseudomonadales bacterium]|nr:hypothetical protein [Pseudomonadales bacterium]
MKGKQDRKSFSMVKTLSASAFLLSLFFSLSVYSDDLALPSDDFIAPSVKHEPLKKSIDNTGSHVISATVSDNIAVQSVTLFFRTEGSEFYKRRLMKNTLSASLYTTTLTPEELKPPGIEYYIQAKDLAGNSVLKGFSFSPLKISIDARSGVINQVSDSNMQAPPETPMPRDKKDEGSIWSNKWLWVGVGAVVLGAAAAGGGGGGSDDPDPATGTLSVSVPIPQ